MTTTTELDSTTNTSERRFADLCPPHRITDSEYGKWVVNVVSTFAGTSDGYLRADIEARDVWRAEARTWQAWLLAG